MSAQVAADLRAAADVLERDGWVQGDYGNVGGSRCVLGAVISAINPAAETWVALKAPDLRARYNTAVEVLTGHLGIPSAVGPDSWNDQPERTADEVIATLRAAADRAEAE